MYNVPPLPNSTASLSVLGAGANSATAARYARSLDTDDVHARPHASTVQIKLLEPCSNFARVLVLPYGQRTVRGDPTVPDKHTRRTHIRAHLSERVATADALVCEAKEREHAKESARSRAGCLRTACDVCARFCC